MYSQNDQFVHRSFSSYCTGWDHRYGEPSYFAGTPEITPPPTVQINGIMWALMRKPLSKLLNAIEAQVNGTPGMAFMTSMH